MHKIPLKTNTMQYAKWLHSFSIYAMKERKMSTSLTFYGSWHLRVKWIVEHPFPYQFYAYCIGVHRWGVRCTPLEFWNTIPPVKNLENV